MSSSEESLEEDAPRKMPKSGGEGKCPHGRRKSQCKDCGGSGRCMTDKWGTEMCPHGREKRRCKECGGSAICPHGRRKSRCKECTECDSPSVPAGGRPNDAHAAQKDDSSSTDEDGSNSDEEEEQHKKSGLTVTVHASPLPSSISRPCLWSLVRLLRERCCQSAPSRQTGHTGLSVPART